MGKDVSSKRFWHWEWRVGYVFAFAVGTILFIVVPAFALLANAAQDLPKQHGLLWELVCVLLILLAPLASHTLLYWGRNITIRGEREYGPRLVAVFLGILAVLVVTGRLVPPEYGSPVTAASGFAGFVIIVLNILSWFLRLIFGRELIFHDEEKKKPSKRKRQKAG